MLLLAVALMLAARLLDRRSRRALADGATGQDTCLLYTSDAADERSSVGLGGRRVIKKKKKVGYSGKQPYNYTHEISTSRRSRVPQT